MKDYSWMFKERRTKRVAGNKRLYDVRITLNKNGSGGRMAIRFGLINAAAEEGKKHGFAEASNDLNLLKNRIYFLFHDAKTGSNVHQLSASKSRNGSPCAGLYFTVTPSAEEEKIYRMNWIGKTYKLQYDEDYELYFIENIKEAKEG